MPHDLPQNFFCLSCHAIADMPPDDPMVGPNCQTLLPRSTYQQLITAAARAALYGYAYREQFEQDLATAEEPAGYAISVDDALVFAAAAAISGVIGNAVYDAVKAAVQRILARPSERNSASEFNAEVIIRYVQEYHIHGLNKLPRELANLIVTEMFIDEKVHLRHSIEGAEMTAEEIEETARQRVAAELGGRPGPASDNESIPESTTGHVSHKRKKRRNQSGKRTRGA